MIKRVFSFLFSLTLLASLGCGEEHESYVGRYEYKGARDGSVKILEIKKDGEEYLVVDEGKPPMKAKPTSEGLDLNGLVLSLTPDSNGILIGGIEARRI